MAHVFHDNVHGIWEIQNAGLCGTLTQARNTITQRMYFPKCSAEITVDGSGLNDGDYAGICALQEYYAMAVITRRDGREPAADRDSAKNAVYTQTFYRL